MLRYTRACLHFTTALSFLGCTFVFSAILLPAQAGVVFRFPLPYSHRSLAVAHTTFCHKPTPFAVAFYLSLPLCVFGY